MAANDKRTLYVGARAGTGTRALPSAHAAPREGGPMRQEASRTP